MRKEQDKKPDFIRDIDTAIMDELKEETKGNTAGLVGEVTHIEEVERICGLPFTGYLAKVETPRQNGVKDEVIVAFSADTAFKAAGGVELDVTKEFATGSGILVIGAVQTLKDFKRGNVLVFILAEHIGLAPNGMMQDEVALQGIIAYEPVYRETPRGKRITDIMVMVKNKLTGNKCFIPCICWQEQAEEAATWQQGDTVELLGRYQSRQYEKVIDIESGEREQRTVREVSVRLIKRKIEVTHEK